MNTELLVPTSMPSSMVAAGSDETFVSRTIKKKVDSNGAGSSSSRKDERKKCMKAKLSKDNENNIRSLRRRQSNADKSLSLVKKRNHFVRNIIKDYIDQENKVNATEIKLRLSENVTGLFENITRKHLENIINCALYFTLARKKNRTQVQDINMACAILGINNRIA